VLKITKFFAFFCIYCFTLSATAMTLGAKTSQHDLSPVVEYLEDPSLTLRLEDVQAQDHLFRPWPLTETRSVPSFGFSTSAYWFRLTLQREPGAAAEWLLEIPNAKLDQIDFYPSNGQSVMSGSSRDVESRPLLSRYFVFPVQLGVEPTQIYIRVTSRYSVTVPLTAWEPDAFRRDEKLTEMLQFMYFGGLGILTLYGLTLFVALRDARFLIYGLYTLTLGLGIFAGNGFGRLVLWPSSPAFDEISQSVFLCLAAFFTTMFARKMLALPGKTEWLMVSIRVCEWLFAAVFVVIVIQFAMQQRFSFSNQLLFINAMVMACVVNLACLKAYRRQQPGIRFFFWSWVILWLGVLTATLRAFGLLPSNVMTFYALQIATTFETVLLAMALADQLRLDVLARRMAQQEALNSKQQVLEVLQDSEAHLKEAVANRTRELESALATETLLREQYVRFGSMVAHEFRTPLSIIQTQMSVMRKEIEHGIDQIPQRLQAIQNATERLTVMFDRWLDNSAQINATFTLSPKPQQLDAWVQAQIPHLSHLLSNHQLLVQLNGERSTVLVDDDHLGIVLSNLIDNACKYSPEGSRVTIELVHKPGFAGICVNDEGRGISEESHTHVFAEFSRLHQTDQIPGVGLGLAIVQRIVLAHGGHVTLESLPDQGATFCIWLKRLEIEGQE
jgi:signal transduction histidine kinase